MSSERSTRNSLVPLRVAGLLLTFSVAGLAWILGDGPAGLGYVGLYGLLLAPGLPIGFWLFGRRHAAGWIAGALIGYGLSALVLWVPADLHFTSRAWLPAVWGATSAATFTFFRSAHGLVQLPGWHRTDTIALLCTLLTVPILLAGPFSRIGEPDRQQNRRYRAYFTADFLWHVALTAELTKVDPPIRNPYLERRALNYYWSYFVPPAMIARLVGAEHSLETCLLLNALCAGLLFVASIYLYGWSVDPARRPGCDRSNPDHRSRQRRGPLRPVPAGEIGSPAVRGPPAEHRRHDFLGLPGADDRQPAPLLLVHTSARRRMRSRPGGADRSASEWSVASHRFRARRRHSSRPRDRLQPIPRRDLLRHLRRDRPVGGLDARRTIRRSSRGVSAAAGPAIAAIAWCVANHTFEGAGGAVVFGLSERAAKAPVATLALAAGPVLVLALAGMAAARQRAGEWAPTLVGPIFALFLFYGVTLTKEPIWIGWRAGQILLVTITPLVALLFARLLDAGRRGPVVAVIAIALVVGLPTTGIDAWNAQDVENTAMGPGFHWTVAVPPDTQAAVSSDPGSHRPRGGRPDVDRTEGPGDLDAHPDVRRPPHGRRPANLSPARRRV